MGIKYPNFKFFFQIVLGGKLKHVIVAQLFSADTFLLLSWFLYCFAADCLGFLAGQAETYSLFTD